MRKLFISFTSLLRLVARNEVTAEDLDQGLFYFGCWREHAMNPGGRREFDERTLNPDYVAAHEVIKAAVLRAEPEGRVDWHNGPNRTGSPWSRLDGLLSKNGVPLLKHRPTTDPWAHYSYPLVRDLITEAELPVEVVY